jgi:arylsulfatase A-like enzyme
VTKGGTRAKRRAQGKKSESPTGRADARTRSLPLLPPLLAGLALVSVVGLGLFFWRRHSSRPTHVVLVSIDTLRADHLGCYGYARARTPNIDRLASESVVFDNAATATPLTLPTHSSLLTGLTPLRHGVVDNFGFRLDASVTTLAETLRAQGFATGGFVGSFVLDSRFGIAQGFDTYFDHFDAPSANGRPLSAHQRPANEVLEPALEWIDRQGARPFFAFLHFFDAHTPYTPPEPYRSSFPDDDVGRYDAEIAFVDEQLGRLVRELDARGILEDTAIVVVGDHGESLGDHGEATHGLFIYDATVRVPLLVRAPGFRAGRARAQVRTIDVMPTVLDLGG